MSNVNVSNVGSRVTVAVNLVNAQGAPEFVDFTDNGITAIAPGKSVQLQGVDNATSAIAFGITWESPWPDYKTTPVPLPLPMFDMSSTSVYTVPGSGWFFYPVASIVHTGVPQTIKDVVNDLTGLMWDVTYTLTPAASGFDVSIVTARLFATSLSNAVNPRITRPAVPFYVRLSTADGKTWTDTTTLLHVGDSLSLPTPVPAPGAPAGSKPRVWAAISPLLPDGTGPLGGPPPTGAVTPEVEIPGWQMFVPTSRPANATSPLVLMSVPTVGFTSSALFVRVVPDSPSTLTLAIQASYDHVNIWNGQEVGNLTFSIPATQQFNVVVEPQQLAPITPTLASSLTASFSGTYKDGTPWRADNVVIPASTQALQFKPLSISPLLNATYEEQELLVYGFSAPPPAGPYPPASSVPSRGSKQPSSRGLTTKPPSRIAPRARPTPRAIAWGEVPDPVVTKPKPKPKPIRSANGATRRAPGPAGPAPSSSTSSTCATGPLIATSVLTAVFGVAFIVVLALLLSKRK